MYTRESLREKQSFKDTSHSCCFIEVLQNPDPVTNGELEFFEWLMDLSHIRTVVDIGANYTPYFSRLIGETRVNTILIDKIGIPESRGNVLSIKGFVGQDDVDINKLFQIYETGEYFLKIDTDANQLNLLKQMSSDNWNKIDVIQFEYDFGHYRSGMIEFVKQRMKSNKCFYINSKGLELLHESGYDDSLYKNILVFRDSFYEKYFSDLDAQILLHFERSTFDKNMYYHLREIAYHEIVVGFTKERRSVIDIEEDTFSTKRSPLTKHNFWKAVYSGGLFLNSLVKKVEKELYQKAFGKR
jgi:hypothetical protein